MCRRLRGWLSWLLLLLAGCVRAEDVFSVLHSARGLGQQLARLSQQTTLSDELLRSYERYGFERFDPEDVVDAMAEALSRHLLSVRDQAWASKLRLESQPWLMSGEDDRGTSGLNCDANDNNVSYVNEYGRWKCPRRPGDNGTIGFEPSADWAGMKVNLAESAVHVPVPVYTSPSVIRKIVWSDVTDFYRTSLQNDPQLSWQYFCSDTGFMRYYPAKAWPIDGEVDLFDCRKAPWYLNGVARRKSVLMLLDVSGSMLGQRFQIARQTAETVLDTLTDADFFNVITFSATAQLLDSCADRRMLPATYRNKEVIKHELRTKAKRAVSGISDYVSALSLALNTITGSDAEQGCQHSIMVITDGDCENYRQFFTNQTNRALMIDYNIRFFTYIIGEEATNFEDVLYMACHTNGYMSQVVNLADAHAKVHHYVRTLSRSLEAGAQTVTQPTAVWTAAYLEHLYKTSNKQLEFQDEAPNRLLKEYSLCTAAAYPVLREDADSDRYVFMGVTAAAAPIAQLRDIMRQQLVSSAAVPFLVRSSDARVLYHDWHRPIRVDECTGEVHVKPSTPSLRQLHVNAIQDDETPTPPDALESAIRARQESFSRQPKITEKLLISVTTGIASDKLQAVYSEQVTYHYRPIKDTPFAVGLVVPSASNHAQLAIAGLGKLDVNWLLPANFRLHPQWQYCTTSSERQPYASKENSFMQAYSEMAATGALATGCETNRRLVEHCLHDVRLTGAIEAEWRALANNSNGIMSVFMLTESGFVRYVDGLLPGVTDNNKLGKRGSIGDRLAFGPDEPVYRSAMLYSRTTGGQPRTHFNLSLSARITQPAPFTSAFGRQESVSFVLTAATALVAANGAPIGLVGYEITYDAFARHVQQHSRQCQMNNTRCYVLDESGRVLYTSANVSYADPTAAGSSQLTQPFASLGARQNAIMRALVETDVYVKHRFSDFQSSCAFDNTITAAAIRLINPFVTLLNLLVYTFTQLSTCDDATPEFSFTPPLSGCERRADVLMLSQQQPYGRIVDLQPCPAVNCTVSVSVGLVADTNLLYLVEDLSGDCRQCGWANYADPLELDSKPVKSSLQTSCQDASEKPSIAGESMCWANDWQDDSKLGYPCSSPAPTHVPATTPLLLTLLLWFYFHNL